MGPARRGSLRGCESSADVLARRTPGHCKRGHTRSVVTRELSGSKAAPPPLPRGLARLDVRPRGPRFAWNSIAREMLVPRPRSRSNDGAQRALSFTFASRRAGVCGSAPSTRMRHGAPFGVERRAPHFDEESNPWHGRGWRSPGNKQASRRLGGLRLRITTCVYLPMKPGRVTRMVIATPARR